MKGAAEDRFEREALAFHRRVRAGYLALARAEHIRGILLRDGRWRGQDAMLHRSTHFGNPREAVRAARTS